MENKNLPIVALFIRYLGVGSIATGVHYSVFLALVASGFADPVLASVSGGVLGAFVSYVGNKRLCFIAKGDCKLQPIRFLLISLAANLGNGMGMWVLIKIDLSPFISQILVTLILTALGFIAHRFWTFNHADITSAFRTP